MAVSLPAVFERWAGCAERLIGSIRRDCLHSERHLRHLLKSYQQYYNEARTHLSLQKDAPIPAPSRASVRRWPCQFWVACTTNISEREFPTGTAIPAKPLDSHLLICAPSTIPGGKHCCAVM